MIIEVVWKLSRFDPINDEDVKENWRLAYMETVTSGDGFKTLYHKMRSSIWRTTTSTALNDILFRWKETILYERRR